MILSNTLPTTSTTLDYQAQIEALKREVSVWRERAERDGLTQCLRREAFMEIIESRRKMGLLESEYTLVVIDIDHFKKVNDTHGHQAGDEALKHVAGLLRECLPEGGLVCRMGGEEFVMLLPAVVKSNRCFLEALRLRLAQTPCRIPNGERISLTASFGAVTWRSDTSMLQASADADALLYRAKNDGRNQVKAA
jgi:diguanylate cyclase (GGDEF)-like protein